MIKRAIQVALLFSLSLTSNWSSLHAMEPVAAFGFAGRSLPETESSHATIDIDSIIENPRSYIDQEPIDATTPENEPIIHKAWIADHPLLHTILKSNVIANQFEKTLESTTINSKGIPIKYSDAHGSDQYEHMGIRIAFRNGNFDTELTNFLNITTIEECTKDCFNSDNNHTDKQRPHALIVKCVCKKNPTFTINNTYIPTPEEISNYCTYKYDIYSSINPETGLPLRIKHKPFIPCTIDNNNFFIVKNVQGTKLMICKYYYSDSFGSSCPMANVCLVDLTRSLWLRDFYEHRIPLIQLALLVTIHQEHKHKKQLELTLKEQSIFNGLLPDMKDALTPYVIPHESTLTTFQKLTRLLQTKIYGII